MEILEKYLKINQHKGKSYNYVSSRYSLPQKKFGIRDIKAIFEQRPSKMTLKIHVAMLNSFQFTTDHEEFEDSFFDTEENELMKENIWISSRKSSNGSQFRIRKVASKIPGDIYCFLQFEDYLLDEIEFENVCKLSGLQKKLSFTFTRYYLDPILKVDVMKVDDSYITLVNLVCEDKIQLNQLEKIISETEYFVFPIRSKVINYIFLKNQKLYDELKEKNVVFGEYYSLNYSNEMPYFGTNPNNKQRDDGKNKFRKESLPQNVQNYLKELDISSFQLLKTIPFPSSLKYRGVFDDIHPLICEKKYEEATKKFNLDQMDAECEGLFYALQALSLKDTIPTLDESTLQSLVFLCNAEIEKDQILNAAKYYVLIVRATTQNLNLYPIGKGCELRACGWMRTIHFLQYVFEYDC